MAAGRVFGRRLPGVQQAGADELIKASVEAGVNFIDTADVYSDGHSEMLLGQSLKNLGIARKDLVLATKAYGRTGKGRNDVGASRGHIMDAVDASLKRLQTEYIDLYQIHATDLVTPIEETLRALDTLVQQGKVRYVGVSNWHAWRIMKALGISELRIWSNSIRFRRITQLPVGTWSGRLCRCWRIRRWGCWFGVRWREVCSRASSAGRIRSRRTSRRSGFDFPPVEKERAWKVLDAMKPIANAHGVSVATVALG